MKKKKHTIKTMYGYVISNLLISFGKFYRTDCMFYKESYPTYFNVTQRENKLHIIKSFDLKFKD